MKWLMRSIVLLALIWSGWWTLSGFGLRQGVATWFDTQGARGWQADYSDISGGGFPLRQETLITAPALADPANGTAWRADWLRLSSPVLWPGDQTITFPQTRQRLSYFDQTIALFAEDMRARLNLAPGTALELREMSLSSGPWHLQDAEQQQLAAQDLTLSMIQSTDPATYDITARINRLRPGDELRKVAQRVNSLPEAFQTLALQMQVRFERPWDRAALETSRPQPRAIDLTLADIHWGALRLQAAGAVTLDDQGIPTGKVALKAENWQEMLAVAKASGAVPDSVLNTVETGLGLLAGLSGNSQSLDLKLGFKNGFVTLGPIPLGPAPRIVLR